MARPRAVRSRGRNPKGKRNPYRRAMARLRAAWGGRCQCIGCAWCSSSLNSEQCAARTWLEFAHVRPTKLRGRGRGRANRYHDVKRNPDAYRLLCDGCHIEFDYDRAHALASAPMYANDTEAA